MRTQIRPHRAGRLRLQGIFQNRSQVAHDGHNRTRTTLAAHIAKIVVAQQHVNLHAALTMIANPFRIKLHGVQLVGFIRAPVIARVAQKHDAPNFRIARQHLIDTGQHKLLLQMQIAHN